MNTKSNKIFHLLAFTSVMCLSAGHAIASTGSQTPALQVSNERWTPPSPPSESTGSPALQASGSLWQSPSALLTKPGAVVKKEDIALPPAAELADAGEPQTPALLISNDVWQPSAAKAAKKESQPSVAPAAASPASPVTPVAKTDQQELESLRKHAILVPVISRTSAAGEANAKAAPSRELQAQMDSLAKQNVELEAKLKVASEAPAKSAEDKAAIEALQSQIDSLAKQNVDLEGKLKTAGEQKSAEPAVVTSPTADQNAQVLKTMQDQIDTLARGNLDLQEKLKNASTQSEPVVATVSGPAIKKKLADGHTITTQKSYMRADFRSNTEEARQANAVVPSSGTPKADVTPLPEENAVQEIAEPKAVKPYIAEKPAFAEESVEPTGLSGELDKLKNRYKQSEAANAKLGDMVKVVKDQCEQEKNQMQSMLFDPQIADEQQRAYISDLEQQLGEAQAALAEQKRSYELKIRLLSKGKGVKTKSES